MSLSTVTITLILVKLNAASFVLPEGQRCDTFCISNSTFNPSEITGVYYLIHILPRDFLEKTSCNSLTIQPPQGNRQDYVFSDTINGARRHIPGYFVSRGSQVDIYHSELELYLRNRQIYTFNQDSFAFVVCTECGFFTEENAGATITVFSRTPYPDCNELDPLLEIIENCGIPLSRLIKVDQSNCDNKCRI